ncbi:MAG: metallophosphoesterase [bacterium]
MKEIYRILHISDLHRTEDHEFSAPELVEGLVSDIGSFLHKNDDVGKYVDAVVFSGDCVNQGSSFEEFSETIAFLFRLYQALLPQRFKKEDFSRLVIVPGNHDVDWQFTTAAACETQDEVEGPEHQWTENGTTCYFKKSEYRKKFDNFARLLSECTRQAWTKDFSQQFLQYPLLEPDEATHCPGLVAIGVNTAFRGNHHDRKIAAINLDVVGEVKKLLREKHQPDRWRRILVQHHPYTDTAEGPSDHVFDQSAANLLEEFNMVLHGHTHQHQPKEQHQLGGRKIPIIGAGTLFAGSNQLPRAIGHEYNLITLNLASGQGQVFPRQRDNVGAPWRPDNRWTQSGKDRYEVQLQPTSHPRSTSPEPQAPPLQPSEPVPRFADADRSSLFKPFLDLAKDRDVIFVLGGVGSGLNTFLHQFESSLDAFPVLRIKADFDETLFETIRQARIDHADGMKKYVRGPLGLDRLELKCLFATLAYVTHRALCQDAQAAGLVDAVISKELAEEPVKFAHWYFVSSRVMDHAELLPIVTYFFQTLERMACAIDQKVVVLMPWKALARCLETRAPDDLKKIAKELWQALGSVVKPQQKYEHVCFVVGVGEIALEYARLEKAAVARCVWPLPPLNNQETQLLLEAVCPPLDRDHNAESVALLVEWTGGVPWLTRVVLSLLQTEFARHDPVKVDVEAAKRMLDASLRATEVALTNGGREPIRKDVEKYVGAIQLALGDGQTTDYQIVDAWRAASHKRNRGYDIDSPRIEAFVASGLVWLDGNPWDSKAQDYVFRRYPTVYFKPASRLAEVIYRHVTDQQIRD